VNHVILEERDLIDRQRRLALLISDWVERFAVAHELSHIVFDRTLPSVRQWEGLSLIGTLPQLFPEVTFPLHKLVKLGYPNFPA
jgi:hypothetical protein